MEDGEDEDDGMKKRQKRRKQMQMQKHFQVNFADFLDSKGVKAYRADKEDKEKAELEKSGAVGVDPNINSPRGVSNSTSCGTPSISVPISWVGGSPTIICPHKQELPPPPPLQLCRG